MLKLPPFKAFFFSYHPWAYFFITFAANLLLSYAPLPLETKLWTGLPGLLLLFFVAWKTYVPGPSGKPLYFQEFLPAVPPWVWVLVAALAIFVRGYKLMGLFVWPHSDEGIVGFYALRIMRMGIDRLLYSGAQHPPFYQWWLSLCFRLEGPSIGSLWSSPLIFSLGFPPLAYLACRQWNFSRSFSFLCAALGALGFWFWYIGRFASFVCLIPLVETAVLIPLALLFRAARPRPRMAAALLLGLAVGLTFYAVYFQWMAVALLVGLTVAWAFRRSPWVPLAFGLSLAAVILPFLVHLGRAGLPPYLQMLWTHQGSPLSWHRMEVSLSYWSAVFWGLPLSYYTFQPIWGGFLNPVLGSCVFCGFLEAIRSGTPLGRWLVAAFLFLLLPGMLSHDSETFRIAAAAVITVPLAALGLARLVVSLPPYRHPLLLLGALLALSFGLDFFHLAGPLHRVWDDPAYWLKFTKSINYYRAFGVLKAQARAEGPGLVFSDFPAGSCDQTLDIADYGFNAVSNPKLDPGSARWAAVLANVNEQPFLVKRFGPGKSYWLSKDLHPPDGGLMLWLVPLSPANRPVFLEWREADQTLDGFIDAYLQNLNYNSGDPLEKVRPFLLAVHGLFQKDSFLETCYWEKMADLSVKAGKMNDAVEALEQAVHSGYPAAHLFYRLGVLQLALNDPPKAHQFFQEAVRAPLDFTESRLLLAQLSPAAPMERKP